MESGREEEGGEKREEVKCYAYVEEILLWDFFSSSVF